MDNLLSHSRVIAYLSKYSLSQAESPRKSFYVILPPSQQVLLTRTKSIPAIASAFGCEGFIFVGMKKQFAGSIDSSASDEHKLADEEGQVLPQQSSSSSSSFGCQIIGANTMKEAYRIAKDELGCEIIGVCGEKRGQSVSLGHTRSFTSRVAFVFLDDEPSSSPKKISAKEINNDAENELEQDLTLFCDRLLYVSSGSPTDEAYSSSVPVSNETYNKQKQVPVELRASIVLHRFAESKWTERFVSN